MDKIFRDYHETDYDQCQLLVENAWDFERNFRPRELATLAGLIYTKGSVLGSNYQKIVAIEGKVAGFIFGKNEAIFKPKKHILFGLKVLWRLMRMKNLSTPERKQLINSISIHEKNKCKVTENGKTEIMLFVVAKEYQGFGYGKTLLSGFVESCRSSNIASIIVETNKLGAANFYERCEFRHKANFNSPLHEYASKGGQACIYELILN